MTNFKILQAKCSTNCIVMKILNDLKINFNIHGDHLFLDLTLHFKISTFS